LTLAEDWDPGEDPRVRQYEDARARLVERLIAAGSAERLEGLHSFDELRLLASLLWLPRNSAPLRRLGLRINSPVSGMAARAVVRGPGFEVEMDNYRFAPANAEARRGAAHQAEEQARDRKPRPQPTPRTPEIMPDVAAAAYSTAPLSDDPELVTRPLPAIAASARLPEQEVPADAPVGMPSAWALTERDPAASETAPRRPWPFNGLLGRREVVTQE
jgi:hypothetical protein